MGTQVLSKILYEEIKALGDGCYVWVDPDEASVLKIQRLLKGAPFKVVNTTELHVTVMFAPECPEKIKVPPDRECKAELVGLDVWIDHKQRQIVVAEFKSVDLERVYTDLTKAGLLHAYPTFEPHMTLCKDLPSGPEGRLWVDQINKRLEARPLAITFDAKLKGSGLS